VEALKLDHRFLDIGINASEDAGEQVVAGGSSAAACV
jgi:hypothetical protein